MMRITLLAAAGAVLMLPLSSAVAGLIVPVNQIVVFGDSLSDNGNAAIAQGGTIPGDYAPNAYTDGPATSPATTGPFGLWIDQFAALAGLPDPQPFLANPTNTNYAVGSAETGTANPQDIGNQVAAFAATHPTGAPSDALYVIWGGANDIIDGSNTGAGAAANLESYIADLASGGAKYFLWLNLPQLGNTPLGTLAGPGTAAALNAQSTDFDNAQAADIALLQSAGVDVLGVDINSLFSNILASPGSYGLSNVTNPAQGTSGDPNQYLFWDLEHPTTAGDAIVAQTAFEAVATPEPASWLLLVTGMLVCFCGAGLRARRA